MNNNNQSMLLKNFFRRLTQGTLLACMVLGFGFAELQAQTGVGASFYNSVGDEITNEITLEPGDFFTLVVSVENSVLVDGVTATMLYDTDLLTAQADQVTDLVGSVLPFPLYNQVMHDIGKFSFSKALLGAGVAPGSFDYLSLEFQVNPDVVFSTSTEISHLLEFNDMSNIVHFGNELMEDAPSLVINIAGQSQVDCPELGLNIGDACDDGDESTVDDMVDADCNCAGTVPTPANDLPCNAESVECGASVTGSTVNATTEGNPTTTCGTLPGANGVWFSLIGDGSEVTVSLCNSDYDTKLNVYNGTCDALVCVTGNDDNTSDCDVDLNQSQVTFVAENGVEYFILVNGWNNTTGNFGMDITCVPFDCPDLLANIGDSCDDGDDTTYDDIVGDDCGCAGTPYDCTELMANIGDACDDGDASTIDDIVTADCGCEGTPTTIVIDCEEPFTSTYCYGSGETTGWTYTAEEETVLNLNFLSGNLEGGYDDIVIYDGASADAPVLYSTLDVPNGAGPQDLSVINVNSTGNIIYMVLTSDGSVSCQQTVTYSGGWEWTVSCGESYDCQDIQANFGDSCDDGLETTYDDVIGDDCQCSGTPYECPDLLANIGDACDDGDDNTFNDVVTADCGCAGVTAPDNDLCEDAIAVECGSVTSGTTINATSESLDFCGTSNGTGGAVWYTFTSESNAAVTVGLCDADYDSKLRVFSGSCGEFVCVTGEDDDFTNCGGNDPIVDFNAEAGVTYYLLVHGYSTSVGNFDLTVDCVIEVDCPELGLNVGDACDDGDDMTENDMVDENCACTGTPVVVWDCPELEANVGDSCDDGDDMTENDMINENCDCAGTPVVVWDCPDLEANIGDSCDDGNANTINDMVDANCACAGTPVEPSDCDDWVMYLNNNAGGVTDIYSVDISSGDAEMTYITTVGYQAHIAYNPNNNLIYVMHNGNGSYVTVNPHTVIPEVSAPVFLSQDIPAITTAAFAPNGKLIVGSMTENIIYSVNVADQMVSVFDGYSPINGGDIAFDDEGMLYLATRSGNGFYQVYPDDVLADQLLSNIPSLVTGMALTETDQMIMSHKYNSSLLLRNLDGSDAGMSYALMLDGEAYDHADGDMTSGCNTFQDNNEGDCDAFSTFYMNHAAGSNLGSLYSVEFSGGDANLTLLNTVNFAAHIAFNAMDNIVYLVNPNGSFIRAYDPTTDSFVGDLPMAGSPAGIVAVVYNPEDGMLYIGSSNTNSIYTVDLGTGVVTFFANAPVSGGDLAIQDGKLYLATRQNHRLHEITEGGAVLVGGIPTNVNGMAQANNSEDVIIANYEAGVFTQLNASDASVVTTYNVMLDGSPFTTLNGDMAAGCGDEDPVIITGDCYGTEVYEYIEGTTLGGGTIPANRSDENQALGAPERVDAVVFTTLGYGGSITIGFGGAVPNGAGDDIEVVETSFNSPGCDSYPEYADVSVSVDGTTWYAAGTVCKGDPFIDISDAGDLDYVMYVRIANNNELTTSTDGYDVDGVVAIHNCEEGPEVDGNEVGLELVGLSTISSYPNPTNGPSQVVFVTAETGRALLEVYDMNGRNVSTLYNQVAEAGLEYRADFNGSNLPNGVYIYKLTTNNETIIEKFMIAR